MKKKKGGEGEIDTVREARYRRRIQLCSDISVLQVLLRVLCAVVRADGSVESFALVDEKDWAITAK